MEYLVLEMYLRHMDETNLPEEKKRLFKKAFLKIVEDKIRYWMRYNKDLIDAIELEERDGWRRDGMKVVDLNPHHKGI